MSQMNKRNFTNRVRALYNIDYNRLPEMPEVDWPRFRDNPAGFFITCDDEMRAAIWREIEYRCRKHDITY